MHTILVMIPNGKEWYYITVKKLSALLRGITSKHHGDFYCLTFFAFIFLEQKANLNRIKKYVKIKNFVIQLCLLKTLK